MIIVETLSLAHIKQLHQLYLKEWWTESRTLDQTIKGVNGSQLTVAAIESDRLVGFARVLTDTIFKALIFDLIVLDEYRGQGVADEIIVYIKKHQSLSQVKHFELYCLPNLFDYYKRHGFSRDVGNVALMRFETRV